MKNTRKCKICGKRLEGRQRDTCSAKCRKAKSRGREPRFPRELAVKNDTGRRGQCVVVAIATALGISANDALRPLLSERRKQGGRDVAGFFRREWEPVIKALGFREVPLGPYNFEDIPALVKGTFLAECARHMFAVVDGVYFESAGIVHKYRRRLRTLWRLEIPRPAK